MPDTLWARLSGPPSKLLPPFFLPIWSRLAYEHGWDSIDFPHVSDLQVIEMKGAETRKHDSTPKQFEVRIALTRNRGYEGRREEEQAEAASKAAVAAHARALTRSHRQAAQLAAAQKQASKQKEEGKEGGRANGRKTWTTIGESWLRTDAMTDGQKEKQRSKES